MMEPETKPDTVRTVVLSVCLCYQKGRTMCPFHHLTSSRKVRLSSELLCSESDGSFRAAHIISAIHKVPAPHLHYDYDPSISDPVMLQSTQTHVREI